MPATPCILPVTVMCPCVHRSALEGCHYRHPFADRISPVVIGGSYITAESGTGLVHTAPGHGQEDYQARMYSKPQSMVWLLTRTPAKSSPAQRSNSSTVPKLLRLELVLAWHDRTSILRLTWCKATHCRQRSVRDRI